MFRKQDLPVLIVAAILSILMLAAAAWYWIEIGKEKEADTPPAESAAFEYNVLSSTRATIRA